MAPTHPDPQVRNAVWQALLNVERLGRYYGALSDRHRSRYRRLRFVLFFAAVGGITRFLDILPASIDRIPEVSALVIIALVIWDFMADYPKKAAVLHTITIECDELTNELHQLWLSVEQQTVPDTDVLHQLRRIDDTLSRVTARAGYADISKDHALNRRTTEEAHQVTRHRFHVATEGSANAQ